MGFGRGQLPGKLKRELKLESQKEADDRETRGERGRRTRRNPEGGKEKLLSGCANKCVCVSEIEGGRECVRVCV